MRCSVEKYRQSHIRWVPATVFTGRWLVNSQSHHGRDIKLVVVLEVPKSELLKRLSVRGRADDTPDAIDERLKIYRTGIYPILTYLTEQNINIVHIDGVGTVGQVHDRIMGRTFCTRFSVMGQPPKTPRSNSGDARRR